MTVTPQAKKQQRNQAAESDRRQVMEHMCDNKPKQHVTLCGRKGHERRSRKQRQHKSNGNQVVQRRQVNGQQRNQATDCHRRQIMTYSLQTTKQRA